MAEGSSHRGRAGRRREQGQPELDHGLGAVSGSIGSSTRSAVTLPERPGLADSVASSMWHCTHERWRR